MKLKTTTLLIVVISLLATSTVQAKTKKLLRFNLKKGSVYEMVIDMDNIVDQEMMGQQIKLNLQMKMVMLVTINDLLPNNNYLISYNYKSIKMEMDAMGNLMSYDSDDPNESNPALSNLKKLTNIDLMLEITPKGKVTNVKGFENFSSTFSDNPQMKEVLKMFSDEESFKSSFMQTFNYFPEEKVSVGDTWENSLKMETLMNMDIKMQFKLTDIKKKRVFLNVDSDVDAESKIEQNGMNIDMDVAGSQGGNMTINSKDGMLISSNVEQELNLLMKMKNPQSDENMEIPMKINSTVKVNVSKL